MWFCKLKSSSEPTGCILASPGFWWFGLRGLYLSNTIDVISLELDFSKYTPIYYLGHSKSYCNPYLRNKLSS